MIIDIEDGKRLVVSNKRLAEEWKGLADKWEAMFMAEHEALVELMMAIELVFDNDWDMTKGCINAGDADPAFFAPEHIDPENIGNNWANRGYLFHTVYEALKRVHYDEPGTYFHGSFKKLVRLMEPAEKAKPGS